MLDTCDTYYHRLLFEGQLQLIKKYVFLSVILVAMTSSNIYDHNVATKMISEVSKDQEVRQSKKHKPLHNLRG